MVRTEVLRNFVYSVEELVHNNQQITYYNILKLKNGLSSKTIQQCFIFCVELGFLRYNCYWRGQIKIKPYYRNFAWLKLRRYVKWERPKK
jgi:hypothetical protein